MQGQLPLDARLFQALPSVTVPGSQIRLLAIPGAVSKELENQFSIPARIAFLRNNALEAIGNQELFVQKSFVLSRFEPATLLVVTISLLTTQAAWRGGWFAASVPVGQEELFVRYLTLSRESVVAGLRSERASGGSRS